MVEQDPSWTLLREDVSAVVKLLSTLIDDGDLLDHLFSDRTITHSQLNDIQRTKRHETSTNAARLLLFDILMNGGKPGSFKAFCNATQKTKGGQDLHAILIRHLPRDIESSAYGTDDKLESTASLYAHMGPAPAMDPIWTSPAFTKNYRTVVETLSLLGGQLHDDLVCARLLTYDQYSNVCSITRREDVAIMVLQILMEGPPGSFRRFYETIKKISGSEFLQKILKPLLESSDYEDPRDEFFGHEHIPQARGLIYSDNIVRRRRKSYAALKVHIALFLKGFGTEWTLIAVCCHENKEMRRTVEERKKSNWILSNIWEFDMNDESELSTVVIQLNDDDKEQLSPIEDIVFKFSRLIGGGFCTSRRLKKAKSDFPASLHFTAKYKPDGKDLCFKTFSFVLGQETMVSKSFLSFAHGIVTKITKGLGDLVLSMFSIVSGREEANAVLQPSDSLEPKADLACAKALIKPISTNVDLFVNEQLVTCIQKGTASGQIGIEGGNLVLPSYDISLIIPPGAITNTAPLSVRLSLFVSEETVDIKGKAAYVGLIELLPHDTVFAKPVILRYGLKHHHRPGADSLETDYRFFYGKGVDLSETYRFVGSLNSDSAYRRTSYKGMNFYLEKDCLELSTLSFCLHCCVIRFEKFGTTISFFVRSQDDFAGEKTWIIRTIISCGCLENLENIHKKQKGFGYSLVDESPLCCLIPSRGSSQKLEFSLSKNDDYTSDFSTCSEYSFSGEELCFLVQDKDFRHFIRNFTIKCSDKIACTQPVKIAYKYYEYSLSSPQKKVLSEDTVCIRLESEALSDYRNDFLSNTSKPSQSRRRKTDTAPKPVSASDSTEDSADNAIALEVRGCGPRDLALVTAAQHEELMRIQRQPTVQELLDVSKRLLKDWKNVARKLGVAEEDIISVENNCTKDDANEKPYQMLLKWMESQANAATVGLLCTALIEEGKAQTATIVFLQSCT